MVCHWRTTPLICYDGNMKQSEALDILKTGRNVFLTGEPGSGKTHTINEYVAYLHSQGIELAITASTGIAATHINGMTIHSWAGIGIKSSLDKSDLKKIGTTKYIVKRVKHAKVLIIDEVSMLSPETLSMVDAVCRQIKDELAPFGGMQVVLVGDFFQLPPVVRQDTETESDPQITLLNQEDFGRFAYGSLAWVRADVTVCYLTEQHRQDDANFLALLSAIRTNTFNNNHLKLLNSRITTYDTVSQEAPKLFSHNMNVDNVNEKILGTLAGEPQLFTMQSQGHDVLISILKRGCLSPGILQLKTGAAVMFTKNNAKEGFVNGTLGIIEGFDKDNNYPIVKIRNGRRLIVEPMDWTIEENGKSLAKISQLPLRLAWAITVHKSQGMSLDEAAMDLGRVFEYGQGYVALSRIRRLSGLHLLGFNERAFLVHPEVLKKDAEFRKQSEKAVKTLADISRNDLKKAQDEFVRLCGGSVAITIPTKSDIDKILAPISLPAGGHGFDNIRKKHSKAYLPWTDELDDELQELFIKKTSIADLASTFNRTKGAIRSRLVKLGFLNKKKQIW